MKKILLTLFIITFILLLSPGQTKAVDTSLNSFNYGGGFNNLIANDTFIAVDSMNTGEIQNFLTIEKSPLKNFSENGRSAAQIIYDAAHGSGGATYSLNGININTSTGTISPKVILTTLEKEQGLISSNLNPSQQTLDCAMGYEWGNGCTWMFVNKPGLKGFTNQVESAAWQLRYNYEAAQKSASWWSTYYPGNTPYYVGINSDIPNSTGGVYNVTFTNAATAALYRYTPYVLNGNYNFWKFYNNFFGNFLNLSVNPIETGAIVTRGVSCGDNCRLSFPTGGSMTLQAQSTPESEFVSWNGCDSASQNNCSIYFNNERSVQANFSQSFASNQWYLSGANNWNLNKNSNLVSGDFNGDGKDEVATMYDYGNNDMGIIIFTANADNTGFTSRLAFRTGPGNWDFTKSKGLVAGNFGGDNKSDLGVLYDYGNSNVGFLSFISDGSTFAQILKWSSGPGNWDFSQTKDVAAGNFRGDSLDDLVVSYDYGNNNLGIWSITTNQTGASTPQMLYGSGAGNWDFSHEKGFISGNFGGDSLSDLAIMYDYGNNNVGLWSFITNQTLPSTQRFIYSSGAGKWNFEKSKAIIAANLKGEPQDSIIIPYDYGNNTMRLWTMSTDGIQSAPLQWYNSGSRNWDASKTRNYVSGNFEGNGKDNLVALYDYGSSNMGLTNFIPTGYAFSK